MKAIEQYFFVVLFSIMAVQGGSNFCRSLCMNSLLGVPLEYKLLHEQYFPIVLLILLYLYKVVLTFKSVDKYCLFLFIFLYF